MAKRSVFTNKERVDCPYLNFFSYQIKNGCHSFRYHRNGIQKNISSKNLDKAKINVFEYCNVLEKNKGEVPKKATETLVSYGEKWLEISKKPNVHKDTYRVYKGVFNLYIKPYFQEKHFNEIDTFYIQEFFNQLPPEKGKTRENIKIVLNGICKLACFECLINKNLMEMVTVKKHHRTNGKCLSKEAEKEFTEKIKGNSKEIAWYVLLYSGVRPCELSSIEFDWINNTMTIKNGKLKSYQKEEYRTVPIFPMLKKLKSRLINEDWKKNTRTMSMRFPKVCPNYRLYDLRHTFITRAKECGVSDELVNIWTGHTPGRTVTANIYTHHGMEYHQTEALKIVYEI